MPLFQQSVLKKYISDIDKAQLQSAWQLFQQHFFNADIQQNSVNTLSSKKQTQIILSKPYNKPIKKLMQWYMRCMA